jgi:CHAT domain-containing protein
MFSLQYAFQLAGARSVVATLWEVVDEDTAMLTRDLFLQLVKGKRDKAEALQQAQVEQINQRRENKLSTHPFFWAALTLTGQWK